MKLFVEQLWGSTYQPWLSESEPWNTVQPDGVLTISQPNSTVKYGIKFLADTESLVTSQINPALKYGIKFLADVSSLEISIITPRKIGIIWDKIAKVSTIWTDINKGSAIWEDYGTILWSWRNQPWLSTSFPWLEGGGVKPETIYSDTSKPSTSYSSTNKPSTNYDNINKPNV